MVINLVGELTEDKKLPLNSRNVNKNMATALSERLQKVYLHDLRPSLLLL